MQSRLRRHLTFVAVITGALIFGVAAVCGSPDATPTPEPGSPTVTVTAAVTVTSETATAVRAVAPLPTEDTAPTPVPATPQDEPTSAPDRQGHLPTASSQAERMVMSGHVYVDARPARGVMRAFINGQQCGDGQAAAPFADDPGVFVVIVESDEHQPGCGVPGAAVTLTINGRAVDQPVEWRPGNQEPGTMLSAGFKVAAYRGTLTVGSASLFTARVVPYVSDVACGGPAPGATVAQDHARWLFQLTVDPREVTAGCGQPGVDVTLHLEIDGRPDIVISVVPWQALPAVVLPNVDLRSQLAGVPTTTVPLQ